jgi:hypothetical protein
VTGRLLLEQPPRALVGGAAQSPVHKGARNPTNHLQKPISLLLPYKFWLMRRYTWEIYANRLVTLSQIYTFW